MGDVWTYGRSTRKQAKELAKLGVNQPLMFMENYKKGIGKMSLDEGNHNHVNIIKNVKANTKSRRIGRKGKIKVSSESVTQSSTRTDAVLEIEDVLKSDSSLLKADRHRSMSLANADVSDMLIQPIKKKARHNPAFSTAALAKSTVSVCNKTNTEENTNHKNLNKEKSEKKSTMGKSKLLGAQFRNNLEVEAYDLQKPRFKGKSRAEMNMSKFFDWLRTKLPQSHFGRRQSLDVAKILVAPFVSKFNSMTAPEMDRFKISNMDQLDCVQPDSGISATRNNLEVTDNPTGYTVIEPDDEIKPGLPVLRERGKVKCVDSEGTNRRLRGGGANLLSATRSRAATVGIGAEIFKDGLKEIFPDMPVIKMETMDQREVRDSNGRRTTKVTKQTVETIDSRNLTRKQKQMLKARGFEEVFVSGPPPLGLPLHGQADASIYGGFAPSRMAIESALTGVKPFNCSPVI